MDAKLLILSMLLATVRPAFSLLGNLAVRFVLPRGWRRHVDADTVMAGAIGGMLWIALLGVLVIYLHFFPS